MIKRVTKSKQYLELRRRAPLHRWKIQAPMTFNGDSTLVLTMTPLLPVRRQVVQVVPNLTVGWCRGGGGAEKSACHQFPERILLGQSFQCFHLRTRLGFTNGDR